MLVRAALSLFWATFIYATLITCLSVPLSLSFGQAEAVVGGQIARAIKQHKEESRATAAAAATAAAVAAEKGFELAATADSTPPKASYSRWQS